MNILIDLDQVFDDHLSRVGGKGCALGKLIQNGYNVPGGFCITTDAYQQFIGQTGLCDLIRMELRRKNLGEMRWEEIWDGSLRIRNHFLRTEMPASIEIPIRGQILARCAKGRFVARSSSPEEDALLTSFAGLHESFINLSGVDCIIKHIKLVWASLWSNRALLYRRELNLDPASSSMAVIIQQFIEGEASGIVFSRCPNDATQSVIESVYGLNQALVDGLIEPDRWFVDRSNGKITADPSKNRRQYQGCSAAGIETVNLPSSLKDKPPIADKQIIQIYETAKKLETLFGTSQDIEWTYLNKELFILQSRPITRPESKSTEDKRLWYISLQRSFENLEQLYQRIESVFLPQMTDSEEQMAKMDLSKMTDSELAEEIKDREKLYQYWRSVYWDEFIPFAHGVRLFGEFYNDAVQPENPAEFLKLLTGTGMISLNRNERLYQLAQMIRSNPPLAKELKARNYTDPACRPFLNRLENFYQQFSSLSWAQSICFNDREDILKLVFEMSRSNHPNPRPCYDENTRLKKDFLNRFQGKERDFAARLLKLACASYRLRDDDNIYLGKIESQFIKAVNEGKRRIAAKKHSNCGPLSNEEVQSILINSHYIPNKKRRKSASKNTTALKARQIIGQPAAPGVATGMARVIRSGANIFDIKNGEILVCEAIDPNMTFIVPLSSGIVESRGGMLIHGAIIAREYKLPCVTGIPEAPQRIKNGDIVTVDGYLGIVTIQRA